MFAEFARVAPIGEETIAAWESRAPVGAAGLWRDSGAGFVGDGFVRVVDPGYAWERLDGLGVLPQGGVVLFVTALADVITWVDDVFYVASFRFGTVHASARGVTLERFVADLQDPGFVHRVLRDRVYGPAAERLGVPGMDECFGYVPLLALGGSADPANLALMGVYEHVAIVGQFAGALRRGAPIDDLTDPFAALDAAAVVSSWAEVRAVADTAGVPAGGLVLPGDAPSVVEGALRVGRTDAGGWVLESVDYGQPRVLVRAGDELGAMRAVAAYVARPLPAVVGSDAAAREQIFAAAAPNWMELAGRLGAGELVIDVPVGVLLNRLGALDGFLLYPADTSLEARSLPPTVLGPVHEFVVRRSFRARVGLTPAWFGRPGGGVRVTIADAGVGVRDLVVDGTLARTVRTDLS